MFRHVTDKYVYAYSSKYCVYKELLKYGQLNTRAKTKLTKHNINIRNVAHDNYVIGLDVHAACVYRLYDYIPGAGFMWFTDGMAVGIIWNAIDVTANGLFEEFKLYPRFACATPMGNTTADGVSCTMRTPYAPYIIMARRTQHGVLRG